MKISHTKKLLVALLIPLFVISFNDCKNNIKRANVVDYKLAVERVMNLFSHSDLHEINADTVKTTFINKKDILSVQEFPNKNLFFAAPWDGIFVNDSLYISDDKQNCIFCIKDNKIVRKIGRYGRAPLEFNKPTNICTNRSIILVQDQANGKVQILTNKFNYIYSIPVFFLPFIGTVAANNKNIYIFNSNTADNLVNIFDIKKKFLFEKSIIPRIVQLNEKPQAMNSITFSSSDDGDFYFSYKALPYIFIYDSIFKHVQIVKLIGKKIGMEKIYSSQENLDDVSVRGFIKDIKVKKDKFVYILLRSKIMIMERVKSKLFLHAFLKLPEDLNPFRLILAKGKIYLCNPFNSKVINIKSDLF